MRRAHDPRRKNQKTAKLTPAASATAPATRPADTSPFLSGVRTVTFPGGAAACWFGKVITPAGIVDVGPLRSPDGIEDGGLDELLDGGVVSSGAVLSRFVDVGGPVDSPDCCGGVVVGGGVTGVVAPTAAAMSSAPEP